MVFSIFFLLKSKEKIVFLSPRKVVFLPVFEEYLTVFEIVSFLDTGYKADSTASLVAKK